MSDTSPTPQAPIPVPDPPRRRFSRRAAIITLVAGIATGIGFKTLADAGFGGWHHTGLRGAPLDPARIDEHVERMLRHLYVEIDATDAQKQQLAPIVKAAAADLAPLHVKIHDTRRQALELLSQASVDRAALESLRDEKIKLVEQASRRLTQALADVADVLTPEQKRQLAEHVGRWRGRHG
jgi:Spy/CpxP family protein refolding chaperone